MSGRRRAAALRSCDPQGLLVGVIAALAAAAAFSASVGAREEATCTQAQKATRTAAVAAYRKQMPAKRRAYFAKVKSAKKRAAFVARQRAKLRSLEIAAACTVVTPLPPSSSANCDFRLAPNEVAVRNRPFADTPMRSFGPLDPDGTTPALGRSEAVMVFVDFPNAPAGEDPSALARTYTANLSWFEEASHGRFSVSVAVEPRWFRMPQPGTAYGALHESKNADRYMADVVAAVGGAVDLAGATSPSGSFPPATRADSSG